MDVMARLPSTTDGMGCCDRLAPCVQVQAEVASLQQRVSAGATLAESLRRGAALQADKLRQESEAAQQEAAACTAQLQKLQVSQRSSRRLPPRHTVLAHFRRRWLARPAACGLVHSPSPVFTARPPAHPLLLIAP